MYLQITTKCNMACPHCCYSCSMKGKHGDLQTIKDSIRFALDYTEIISIGGGEPTLHPDFFEILKTCLWEFDSVWMATNGSKTDIMYRLDNIINQEDYPECDCQEEYTKEELIEYTGDEYGCLCHEKIQNDTILQENKLTVALSQDYFHDPIDQRIIDLWKSRKYEIRDVTEGHTGIIAEGRAKRTGSGWNEEGCVCPDLLIRPDGKIKLCGCKKSPIIGDVYYGIEGKWDEIIRNNEEFNDTRCFKALN